MPVLERFRRCEIEINSQCDMTCFGCDRFIDVAPTSPMTVDQIALFVEQSLALDWEWERIHILGGEPTIHPQFWEVVEELLKYKQKHPATLLRVISNGSGHLAKYHQRLLASGIVVNVEEKKRNQEFPPWFRNTRCLVIEEHPTITKVAPCSIFGIAGCGLGITKHGIFLCGAGASVARMLGLDIGVMDLAEASYEIMLDQAKLLCHLCGHWNPSTGTPAEAGYGTGPQVLRDNLLAKTGIVTGPFWEQAIQTYKTSPPILSLYGANSCEQS